jgi:uroporphyrinogen-III synthase
LIKAIAKSSTANSVIPIITSSQQAFAPMPKPSPPINLAGMNVLVTRPAAQASEFAEAIQQARGRPICFPTLEILGPADKIAAKQTIARLDQFDLLIFTSTNAVQYAFPLFPTNIPLDLPIAAIGSATAAALSEAGLPPTLCPDKPQSEGLLALPELQAVQGLRILIVRGTGGREALKLTLEERGAQVNYAEVYRRQCPVRNPQNLIKNWATLVDVVTVSSNEILNNLYQMLGETGQPLLHNTPLVVPSTRITDQARQLGCLKTYQARSALDHDMLFTLGAIRPSLPI